MLHGGGHVWRRRSGRITLTGIVKRELASTSSAGRGIARAGGVAIATTARASASGPPSAYDPRQVRRPRRRRSRRPAPRHQATPASSSPSVDSRSRTRARLSASTRSSRASAMRVPPADVIFRSISIFAGLGRVVAASSTMRLSRMPTFCRTSAAPFRAKLVGMIEIGDERRPHLRPHALQRVLRGRPHPPFAVGQQRRDERGELGISAALWRARRARGRTTRGRRAGRAPP